MIQILEFVVLAFATVGLIAFGGWIFRGGWGPVWKGIGLLAVVSLWVAMCSSPMLGGRSEGDHGILTDLIATFGIAIVGTWAFQHTGNDWRRQTAIIVGAFALLLFMWIPRYKAGQLSLPSSPTTSAPVMPPPAPVMPPPAPVHTPSHSDEIDPSKLSPHGREVFFESE